jgi:hypothetical protein
MRTPSTSANFSRKRRANSASPVVPESTPALCAGASTAPAVVGPSEAVHAATGNSMIAAVAAAASDRAATPAGRSVRCRGDTVAPWIG